MSNIDYDLLDRINENMKIVQKRYHQQADGKRIITQLSRLFLNTLETDNDDFRCFALFVEDDLSVYIHVDFGGTIVKREYQISEAIRPLQTAFDRAMKGI